MNGTPGRPATPVTNTDTGHIPTTRAGQAGNSSPSCWCVKILWSVEMINDLKGAMLTEPDTAVCSAAAPDPRHLRHQRTRRIFSAWVTSAPSKVATLLVQVIAIPTVYRSIGPPQFASY